MAQRSKPYPPAKRTQIIASYRRTQSILQAAAACGVSQCTVWRIVNAAGIPMDGNSTPLDERALLALYRKTQNVSEVARQFGVCRQKVRAVLDAHAVEHQQRRRRPDVKASATLDSYRRTRSGEQTAAELGVGVMTVYRRLRAAGVSPQDYRHWTEEELALLQARYPQARANGKVAELAAQLQRPLATTFLKARQLGLSDPFAPKLWLRTWTALSQAELRELFDRFKASGLTVGEFAAGEGFDRDGFARAMRAAFPGEWETHLRARARAGETPYGLGVNVEYEVVAQLRRCGVDCYVSPGSRTAVDLIGVGPGGLYAIQCKRSGQLVPAEWNALLERASHTAATPLLAANPSGREVVFWRLLAEKVPGVKTRRQPYERVWFTAAGELTTTDPEQVVGVPSAISVPEAAAAWHGGRTALASRRLV